MHLTRHSDYSLRVLIFLAVKGQHATISEIAEAFAISRAHLTKVVHELAQLGYVATMRGRGGGLTLGKAPREICVGRLLRQTEENLVLVDCLSSAQRGERNCVITPACKLKGAFAQALQAFFAVLDRYTLADLVEGRAAPLQRLLRLV